MMTNMWIFRQGSPGLLVWTITIMIYHIESQSPVFIVDPFSVAAIDGTTVEFTCTANNTDTVTYRVNDTSATSQSVVSKGFTELNAEEVDSLTRRNLTVTVSSLYNNTEIFCRAVGSPMNTDSEIAILIVQGPLLAVGDLSSFFINSSTIIISWSPPFTLPGTAITGYNLSVTSNGTTTNYFTSDSHYVLQWSDFFSCNDSSVTVSGYNGLDGETLSLNVWRSSVPPSDVTLPVSVIIESDLQFTVVINVTILINICERPSSVDVDLFNLHTSAANVTDIMLPQDPEMNILTVNTTLTVLEDQRYTAVVSFSNLAGEFSNSVILNFTTFGVESVVITDNTGGRVCLECSFYSFSTDTGCTIELLISGSVSYRDTFNRSGDTAKGCVSGVTAGEYVVRVYDQNGSELVHILENVTVLMLLLLPSTPMMSPSSSARAEITVSNTATLAAPSDNDESRDHTSVITGAVTGGAVFICIVLMIIAVCVIVWKKNKGRRFIEKPCSKDEGTKDDEKDFNNEDVEVIFDKTNEDDDGEEEEEGNKEEEEGNKEEEEEEEEEKKEKDEEEGNKKEEEEPPPVPPYRDYLPERSILKQKNEDLVSSENADL